MLRPNTSNVSTSDVRNTPAMRSSWVSWSVTIIVLAYAAHAIWSVSRVWVSPHCESPSRCLPSALASRPHQDLVIFAQPSFKLLELKRFDYLSPLETQLAVPIPSSVRNNGTMSIFIYLVKSKKASWERSDLVDAAFEKIPLVIRSVPRPETFNLLGDKNSNKVDTIIVDPVSHIKSSISFSILTDPISLSADAPPSELFSYLRINKGGEYLPIIQYDFLKSRLRDLVQITSDTTEMNITLSYSPASIGKIKFLVHLKIALKSFIEMGFTRRDVDDVKGMFADTNLYLLCATVLVSSIHLLFDVLAFKNDISFWRAKTSMAGLSVRTVLWRAFSQCIITLYLLDENTSLLVLIPSGIAAIIELWKVKKILHINIDWREKRIRIAAVSEDVNKAEMKTRAVDAEAMQYLSYILYPLCICGAIYSLIYQPHKSWYSWTLNSMVNGVYAFGFIFMLPQLFINYRMKSVAALPWRAFMYKAFNTFIDDVFAFIITMPVAHRVACFRDDIVFIIYLYQRWLYPVDKNRVDDSYSIEETVSESHAKKE